MLTSIYFSNAQTSGITLYGTVLDSVTMLPLENANIFSVNDLSGRNEKPLGRTIADGRFEIRIKDSTIRNIVFSYVGYKRQSLPLANLKKNESKIYFEIHLSPEITLLDSVNISAQKELVVHNGDTITYDVSNFFHNKYDDADALVFQIPGMYLNHEGRLMAQGKDVMRITVDGSEFFLSDPNELLKIIPAEAVEKIQLINGMSEESEFTGVDDGQRNKEINIILKPDKRTGFFSNVASQLGTKSLKGAEGELNVFKERNRFATNITANNVSRGWNNIGSQDGGSIRRADKMPNFSNLDFNYSKENDNDFKFLLKLNSNNSETFNRNNNVNQINAETENSQTIHRNINGVNATKLISLESKLEYRDERHSFLAKPKIDFRASNTDFLTNQSITEGAIEDRILSYQNMMRTSEFTPNFNAIYSNKLNNKGRLFSASLTFLTGNSHQKNKNESMESHLNNTNDDLRDFTETSSDNRTTSYTINLQYNEPLSKILALQSHIEFTSTRNKINYETELQSSGYKSEYPDQTPNSPADSALLTNLLRSSNSNAGFRTNLLYTRGRLKATVGASFRRIMQSTTDSSTQEPNRSTNNTITPSFNINFRPNNVQNINFSYNMEIVPPSPFQLQEFTDMQDAQNINLGNARLKNENSHQLNLSNHLVLRNGLSSISTSINLKMTGNKITNSIIYATQDTIIENIQVKPGARVSKPVNVDGFYQFNANNSITHSILQNKVNGMLNLNYGAFRQSYYLNGLMDTFNAHTLSGQFILNYFDLRYRLNLSYLMSHQNSSNALANHHTRVFNQVITNSAEIKTPLLIDVSSNLNYQITKSSDFQRQDVFVWNIGLKRSLLKASNAAITFHIYDVFNNSKLISYNVRSEISTQGQHDLMGRFYMVSLTYNFRKFGL